MIVCIAEKPAVAREIAHVLGATAQHTGYYEGNGYQVTWTYGHLCTLKEPNDYMEMWKRWNLGSLPMIPNRFGIKLIEMDHIKKQYAIVERLYQNADSIVNCGDAGQEGELIQRWVMQKAGVKCPVKRLWISSLTEEAIREGFRNLRDQKDFEPLYLAGLSRAIGDWLLGMNATRLYTIKYKDNNNRQDRQPLSIGRVQTPTLAMIVNRQREIENFVPKQSWVLSTMYRDTKFNGITHDEEAEAEDAAEVAKAAAEGKTQKSKGAIYKPLEYLSKEEGERVLSAIKDQPLRVTSVTKKKGTEKPPQLFDLTTLQVECNKKFSFTAEQTLNIIQSLYEKKFTTYPRVDTQYLTDDIYSKCPQTLNGLYQTKFAGVAPYADIIRTIGGKPLRKDKKVFDNSKVTDHHAIIPTGVIPQGLNDNERKVFDIIARRFIAVFYDDCKFETTTVMAEVTPAATNDTAATNDSTTTNVGSSAAEPVLFRTSGKVIIDEGWKVVFKKNTADESVSSNAEGSESTADEKASSEEKEGANEGLLPVFTRGEEGSHLPLLSEKWTTPPPYYTEATLLRAMETAGRFVDDEELRAAMKENGIGRPSSRANIIETLFKRQYIKRERKRIVATPTGKALIDVIHEDLLKSPELTGIWEKKLRDIEAQKYDAGTFINELKQQITDIVNQVLSDNSNRKM